VALKQIEISGFKSFAKKSVLDFKTPITAIVGPNGSGKSNVAEAFSFVLGEQSIKSLRGKRGEDLIYNGSNTGNRANRASVKVVLDNNKKLLDLDFDEVAIERVVYRDGVNNYLINGSQVRLKDVIELLAGANIGSTGHHIISQGEADRILNVNPKERKAVIEDALGLKIYQIKKKDSRKKLQKTEENIKQAESLRREIKPHLKFLEKQAEKIQKTLEMKEALILIYKEYFKRENLHLESRKNRLAGETKEPKERLQRLDMEIEKLEKSIIGNNSSSSGAAELKELEEKITRVRQEKGKFILELGRLEGELKSLHKILGKDGEQSLHDKISFPEVRRLLEYIEKEINSLEKEAELSKIRAVLSLIKSKLKNFISSFSPAESKNFEEQISVIKAGIKGTEKDIRNLIFEEDKLKMACENLRKKMEESRDVGIEAERKIFDLKTRRGDARFRLNELKGLREKLELEEGEYKRELAEAAVLTGRETLNFENFDIKNEEGRPLEEAEILAEEREKQEGRKKEIQKIKIRLEDAGGASGEEIMKEYEEVKERDSFLDRESRDLEESANSLEELIKDLDDKLEEKFTSGLKKINEQFQDFFSLMFGGGLARLEISKGNHLSSFYLGAFSVEKNLEEDSEEESGEEESQISDGVEIQVSLPKKKIKNLMMLSGGERALTSIALLFAMSQVTPPPFIILDETDAALDEANSRKYGDMVESLSKHSQLILITHNRETMSRAGVLYGVTMDGSGVSKLLSVDLEEAEKVAK